MRSLHNEIAPPARGNSPANPLNLTREKPAWLAAVSWLLVLVLMTGLVLLQMVPPAVVTRSAPATSFSAERAFDHLQHIASRPHPTGSPENEQVRRYLLAQLTGLGLQPETQTGTSVYHDTGKWGIPGLKGMEVGPDTWAVAGATVHNVMARIPGTDSTGAVVLAAHYDSVPYGPGAGDDGTGVAAILETARAILAGPPPRNDIILLLTDGEEIGLMGSQLFADQHPWMGDVALVLNLEARGNGGTVLMYETNPENDWIIREYARATVAPLTGSVATDIWRLMPNSSDLTVFLENGKQGMNFAFAENWTAYHTTRDSLAGLDPRSLQHQGDNVLALARHFASLDVSAPEPGDAVFFSVLRLGIIHYPKSLALPFLAVALLAYLAVLVIGIRSGLLSLRETLLGLAALLAASGAAALVSFVFVSGLSALKGSHLVVGMGGTYNVHWYELGLFAIQIPVSAAIYAGFQHAARPAGLAMGALFFWLVLAAVSTLLLVGASYLFLLPLAAGLIATAATIFAKEPHSPLVWVLQRIPLVIGLVLVGTVVYLVQLMFGIAILPAGGFLTALILSLAFPYISFRSLPRPSAWLTTPAVLGAALILATAFLTQTRMDQPRLNYAFYSMNADSRTADWVAETHLPDPTLAALLGDQPHQDLLSDHFPTGSLAQVWVQDAPVLDVLPPHITVIEDSTGGSVRTLRLNLSSPRGAYAIMADIFAQDAILSAGLYGEQYNREAPRSSVFFKVIDVPQNGVEITLTLRAGVPVIIRLADITPGLLMKEDQQAAFQSAFRSGFGGGHGIDSMTLVHRAYNMPGE